MKGGTRGRVGFVNKAFQPPLNPLLHQEGKSAGMFNIDYNKRMTNFLTKKDVRLYHEGKHYHIYEKLGAHFTRSGGQNGVHFAVWAPNAAYMSVMGEWNNWSKSDHPMDQIGRASCRERV